MNFLNARVVSESARLSIKGDGFQIPLPAEKAARLGRYADQTLLLGIRPENLLLTPPGPESHPLRAKTEIVEAIGSDICLNFSLTGTAMTARVDAGSDIKVGQQVALYPDPQRIHLFHPESGIRLY